MKIPSAVTQIIQALNKNGYEAFLVGGCVRDSIMGKTPEDWDIATSAVPQEVKALFPRTFDTGILHGTVTVVMENRNYEVTTYRIDGKYLDNRRPAQVTFASDLREDLLRRDFTMNAIAYHKDFGYIDPYDGLLDIKSGIVRGVGEPSKRFNEDGLRMLRAVRFSAQLNFTIEEKTWAALLDNAGLIQNISMERVRDEFLKLLISDNPKISLLYSSGLMEYVDSSLNLHMKTPNPYLTIAAKEPCMRLAVLLRNLDGDEKKLTERLKYFRMDNKSIKLISMLLSQIEIPLENEYYAIRKRISEIGAQNFEALLAFSKVYADLRHISEIEAKYHEITSRNECVNISQLAVNGDDLKAVGITCGTEIGRALKMLLEHVLAHPEDNQKQKLIKYLQP